MKKSKLVSLVLISAALASCHKKEPFNPNKKNVYMRGDTTANYSRTHHSGSGNAFLWWYAFRPYGSYMNGAYHHNGYYSGGISESSNIGRSSAKTTAVRGGFGGRGFSVSS